MKKHVRVFLAVCVVALTIGYLSLLQNNDALEQQLDDRTASLSTGGQR
jgi:hypothetical protein